MRQQPEQPQPQPQSEPSPSASPMPPLPVAYVISINDGNDESVSSAGQLQPLAATAAVPRSSTRENATGANDEDESMLDRGNEWDEKKKATNPNPNPNDGDGVQNGKDAKRVITFEHGEFTASSETLTTFSTSRPFIQRIIHTVTGCSWPEEDEAAVRHQRSSSSSASASSTPRASSHDPSSSSPPAPYRPSVHRVMLQQYQRERFGSNRVRSARYTLLSFLPLNLYEQMTPWHKPANAYFGFIACLQAINAISTTNGRPSILVPLLFVLAVTAIKDAIEDYHRSKADKEKNHSVYTVLRRNHDGGEARWRQVYSKDIVVGDMIRVNEDGRVPCDMLLIGSGLESGSHVLIDTKDLDGETNLKPKFVPTNVLELLRSGSHSPHTPLLANYPKPPHSSSSAAIPSPSLSPSPTPHLMLRCVEDLSGELVCDEANGEMGEWHATLTLQPSDDDRDVSNKDGDSVVMRQNLALDSLILGECVIRNTPYAIGLVVYTGDSTKLRMNMSKQLRHSRRKESRVFKLTKKLFLVMALLQICLCIAAGVASGLQQQAAQTGTFYLRFSESAWVAAFQQMGTWFILAKDFVPISLYVSLELVQFFQSIFIGLDREMSVEQTSIVERYDNAKLKRKEKDKEKGEDSARKQKDNMLAAKESSGDVRPSGPMLMTERVFAKAQTSSLNEELGQIAYIFSDKTGTLTQNSMQFKKCVIGRSQYGRVSTEAGVIRRAKIEGRDITEALQQLARQKQEMEEKMKKTGLKPFPHVQFDQTDELMNALHQRQSSGSADGNSNESGGESNGGVESFRTLSSELDHSSEIRHFLLALALNNAAFPKVDALRSGPPDELDHGEEEDEGQEVKDSNNRSQPATHPSRTVPHGRARHRRTSSSGYNLSLSRTHAVMSLESSSPDETALCSFAQYCGFELFSRSGGRAVVRVRDRDGESNRSSVMCGDDFSRSHFEEYVEAATFAFTPKRKRMTVLVEPIDPITGNKTGRIHVYTKGADSFVYPLLQGANATVPGVRSNGSNVTGREPRNWDFTSSQLVEFGGESLRCLVVAHGECSHEWWYGDGSVNNRGMKERYESTQRAQGVNEKGHTDGSCSSECSMCDIETRIEKEVGLQLLGATGVEDMLQGEVGSALKTLLDAHIAVWMLTGDTVSTAINIGISCNLLDADMEKENRLFKLDREQATSLQAIVAVIEAAEQTIANNDNENSDVVYGLAVHSDAWKLLINAEQSKAAGDAESSDSTATSSSSTSASSFSSSSSSRSPSPLSAFFSLSSQCRSVIACRLEPREKAEIVEEMRHRTGKTCLAIGDGNNDTPMIRAADVGVGVRGVEGTSAVASADFAISRFAFLTRLLLVYGHLNYRRISMMVLYIFYKSSILVWSVYFLGAYSMYSGQALVLDWTFQLYNIAYTALPILVLAVFDRDFTMPYLQSHPLIYSATRGPTYFNARLLFVWLFSGFLDAAICFFIPWYTFAPSVSSVHGGRLVGFSGVGLAIYTCIVHVVNVKLAFFVRSWTWLHVAAFILSLAAYWLATAVFSASSVFSIGGINYRGLLGIVGSDGRFWFALLLCIAVSVIINLLLLSINEVFAPSSIVQIFYERATLNKDGNSEQRGIVTQPAFKQLQSNSINNAALPSHHEVSEIDDGTDMGLVRGNGATSRLSHDNTPSRAGADAGVGVASGR